MKCIIYFGVWLELNNHNKNSFTLNLVTRMYRRLLHSLLFWQCKIHSGHYIYLRTVHHRQLKYILVTRFSVKLFLLVLFNSNQTPKCVIYFMSKEFPTEKSLDGDFIWALVCGNQFGANDRHSKKRSEKNCKKRK